MWKVNWRPSLHKPVLPHVCTYMCIYACPLHTCMPHTHILKKEYHMIISTDAKRGQIRYHPSNDIWNIRNRSHFIELLKNIRKDFTANNTLQNEFFPFRSGAKQRCHSLPPLPNTELEMPATTVRWERVYRMYSSVQEENCPYINNTIVCVENPIACRAHTLFKIM